MLSSDFIVEHARPWLLFLEGLQDLGISQHQFAVPQIAVFGDQSSGKSSLLESISGIPFPKGTGLVTRCPTRISMVHSSIDEEWTANIVLPEGYSPSEQITKIVHTPTELANLLNEAANIITRNSLNGFSKDCIHVNVRSPHTPDLSLIDLPGIIRTTTFGQDKSVIAEVDHLLSEFMSQSETIILAVIPSNQDIATIDILERAHRYDPSGERTIGVLTKPDLIDKGGEEEVLKIIQNIRKPLKLGYIMVKNRNQLELKNALSLSDGLQYEENYFQNHEIWKLIDPKSRGIKSLCNKLTNLIVHRAMEKGPFFKHQLLEKSKEIHQQLQEIGIADLPTDDFARRKLLMKIITRYTQTLRQISNGDYRDPLPTKHASLRLKYFMNQLFSTLQEQLSQNVPDLKAKDYSKKLSTSLVEMRGRELPGFSSTRLLLSTVSQELDCWRSLIEDLVLQSIELYQTIGENLCDRLASQFPKLNKEIKNSLTINMAKQTETINRRVEEMFEHSTEGASSDQELINTINNIRFARFDQTLREALTVITKNLPHLGQMGIPMNPNTQSNVPAPNNHNIPRTPPNQPSANGSVSNTAANPATVRNSISNPNGAGPHRVNTPPPPTSQNQIITPQPQPLPGNPQQNGPITPHQAAVAALSKEELKSYITDILGNAYMSIHGIDSSTILHLDEAIAVLQSYWRMNEKRIHEEIQSLLDMILLQQCSENIEKDLLTNVQLFIANNDALSDLFEEDPSISKKRSDLTQLKAKIEKLLLEIEKLIPNLVAKAE